MNRHARLLKLGLDTNPLIATRLINEYVACFRTQTSLSHAHRLFDQVAHKDTILWISLISAYSLSNQPHKALQLFSLMLRPPHSPLPPNPFVFATAARAVASSPEHLHLGRTIHSLAFKSGFVPSHIVVGTALLGMYSKCGVIQCARKVFDEMPDRNLITWNAMIAGCVHNGMEINGLELFCRMKCIEFCTPDEFNVATVLAGCARAHDLVLGVQIHGYAIVSGFELVCVNPIGNMYFQCGEVSCGERVLGGIEEKVVSKLIKIRGYVFNQRYRDAISYVASENKIAEIFEVDGTVFVPLLTACAELSLLKVGRQVHGLLISMVKSYCYDHSLEDDNAIIGSALINMYCKCSSVGEARIVFDASPPQVALWNSMISGYMYNGLVEDARALWEEIPERNVVSWTSMISGYVQNCMPREGLDLLSKMYSHGDEFRVEGNCFTFVVGLEACSHITNLEMGKQIHGKLMRTLPKLDIGNVAIGIGLVDMYSKGGKLSYAQTCFDLMAERDVVAWTSIITGYAVNGFGSRALEIFEQMMETGVEPNEVTFVSILTVCSHCGLVDEGLQYFKLMRDKYKVIPREDHYTCLIDMLGRAGRLEEAWTLVGEIEDGKTSNGCFNGSNGSIWAAMLGACQLHGNVEMGRIVAKKMLKTKKDVSGTYVTLSNVYALAGMWNDVYKVRENWRKESYGNREPALSRICTSLY
ncbi:Pentatricopeptide repeat-containing protein [Actinidia chinensis var. chinensis]|uniref:Pentatricopeptide repeat-containing protein n=1 Tax=Actinidia chinensis var. chinensis TaxID=1590841 RepID=A0A2R6PPG6_ACTCC|nr:Pentatricopeptide repeat-containing protein [Actinidia chinensis var. chinensis]